MSCAKAYLQRIKRIDDEIAYQLDEIERLREMLTRITPIMKDDGASGGGYKDKIASGVAKIIDLQNEINKSIDTYADTKAYAMRTMKRMERKDYAKLLHMRYFQYKTWEEIAAEMKYSYRGICYMHGRALVEFEKNMVTEEVKNDDTTKAHSRRSEADAVTSASCEDPDDEAPNS